MYRQLLNLYTLEEYLKKTQKVHTSVYITPNGKIFDCKQNGVISHSDFARELYSNYRELMQIHKDIDFNTEVSEFILDDENFKLKEVIEFYKEQFDYLQYENMDLYNMVKNNYLATDNILVHDLGFVKVSINRGMLPEIELPLSIFNGKEMTIPQYKSLLGVLQNNTISTTNYDPKRFVDLKEREYYKINKKLSETKVALQTQIR